MTCCCCPSNDAAATSVPPVPPDGLAASMDQDDGGSSRDTMPESSKRRIMEAPQAQYMEDRHDNGGGGGGGGPVDEDDLRAVAWLRSRSLESSKSGRINNADDFENTQAQQYAMEQANVQALVVMGRAENHVAGNMCALDPHKLVGTSPERKNKGWGPHQYARVQSDVSNPVMTARPMNNHRRDDTSEDESAPPSSPSSSVDHPRARQQRHHHHHYRESNEAESDMEATEDGIEVDELSTVQAILQRHPSSTAQSVSTTSSPAVHQRPDADNSDDAINPPMLPKHYQAPVVQRVPTFDVSDNSPARPKPVIAKLATTSSSPKAGENDNDGGDGGGGGDGDELDRIVQGVQKRNNALTGQSLSSSSADEVSRSRSSNSRKKKKKGKEFMARTGSPPLAPPLSQSRSLDEKRSRTSNTHRSPHTHTISPQLSRSWGSSGSKSSWYESTSQSSSNNNARPSSVAAAATHGFPPPRAAAAAAATTTGEQQRRGSKQQPRGAMRRPPVSSLRSPSPTTTDHSSLTGNSSNNNNKKRVVVVESASNSSSSRFDNRSQSLSDIPSDVDSETRERYLLACRLLKSTILQKDKALLPSEKNFLTELLRTQDASQVENLETASQSLLSDPLFQMDFSVASSAFPSNETSSMPYFQEEKVNHAKEVWHEKARSHSPALSRLSDKTVPTRNTAAKFRMQRNVVAPEEFESSAGDDDEDEERLSLVSFGAKDYPFCILGISSASHFAVLTPPVMEALGSFFPFGQLEENFWLKFSLARDGASLHTLLSKVRTSRHTIVGVETKDGQVFGAFVSTPWRIQSNWYGSSECFLWRLKQPRQIEGQGKAAKKSHDHDNEMEIYPFTGHDEMIQYCTKTTMAVGGGDWTRSHPNPHPHEPSGIGFLIDGDLMGGETNSCATFDNPRLVVSKGKAKSSSNEFDIVALEVWTVTPCTSVSEAEKLEMHRTFIEQHSK